MKIIKLASSLLLAGVLVVPGLSLAAEKATNPQPKPQMSIQQSVNVNTADASTLESVIGLGPSKAKAIVNYRQQHGKFASVDDLTQVPGIGDKLLAKIKSQLTV